MQLGLHPIERTTFDIERKGFDRDQVRDYLHEVAVAMARLEGEARAAELAVDHLQRQVRDLSSRSVAGFRQSAANLVTAATPVPVERPPDTEAAENVLTAAHREAERLVAHARTIVEEALVTTEKIETSQDRLLDRAKAERDVMLREAREEADVVIASAAQAAVATRRKAQRFAEELRELTATETIQLVSYAKTMAMSILEAAGGVTENGGVTVDLRAQRNTGRPVEWSMQPAPSEEGSGASA